MPPSLLQQQYIPSSSSSPRKSQDEAYVRSEKLKLQEKQYECFTKHCRIFYRHSLSIIKNNHERQNKNKTSEDDDINTSREIMNVFHSLLLSSQEHDQTNTEQQEQKKAIMIKKTDFGYSELIKCGLCNSEISNYHMTELVKIRDNERRKAHELGMKLRFQTFYNILLEQQQKQQQILSLDLNNNDDDNNNGKNNDNKKHQQLFTTLICNMNINMREQHKFNCSIKYVNESISLYKKNIGMHPIFAGMRKLLETQMKHNNNIIHWKFYSIAITESFDNNNNMNDNNYNNIYSDYNIDDSNNKAIMSYFQKVCNMFFSFLMLVSDDEVDLDDKEDEEKKIDSNNDHHTGNILLFWKVKESFNKRKMRKLLNCFPHERDIYTKSTGTFIITDRVRNSNSSSINEKDFWCF